MSDFDFDDADDFEEAEPEVHEPRVKRASAKAAPGDFTKNQFRQIIGCAPATLQKWIEDGLPVKARGSKTQPWIIHAPHAIDWIRQRDRDHAAGADGFHDFESAKRREKDASAKLKELQIAERERSLVPKVTVLEWISRKFSSVRTRVLQVDSQMFDLNAAQRLDLKRALTDALSELSEGWEPEDDSANFDSE